ncbi:MAG: hypothetical protein IKT30_00195 [Bacteroidaceae bacterium]|nr:hypothetical protein [Bacteroidaceae bacterium]
MKTVKMPVLDRNAKTITATREFLIRAGQFGSTEFNILLDIQKNNPGYTVVEHKIKRNPNKNVHEALTYDEMIDFIKGYHESEDERKESLTEFFIIKKASKTTPAAYAYVKKWFFGKYKAEFEAYEQAKKDKKEAAANKELEEFLAAAI